MIAVLWALSLAGIVALEATGHGSGTAFGVLLGANGTLFVALTDALAVERRRRDPHRVAIADDVRPNGLSVVGSGSSPRERSATPRRGGRPS